MASELVQDGATLKDAFLALTDGAGQDMPTKEVPHRPHHLLSCPRILHRRATWMLVVVGLALTAIPSLFWWVPTQGGILRRIDGSCGPDRALLSACA